MFKRILVPLDGSELAESALPYIVPLAQCMNAQVILLRIVTMPASVYMAVSEPHLAMDVREDAELQAREYLDRVAARLRADGVQVSVELNVGAVADSIREAAQTRDADLIAMSTHGRGGLARLMIGSVADEIVRNSHIPVLLVRPK